ncbi:MAG: hypothetical protein RR133_02870 [Kiritimatiellia bacterium]
MNIEALTTAFADYYRSFPSADMNDLKYEHTRRVVANAKRIITGEHFPSLLHTLGEVAAWLHDLGRFRQFQQYHTFNDSQSVNHALLSCGETLRLGWLDDFSAADRNLILRAIEFHNLCEVPLALSLHETLMVHLVRDADKLDIFTVLDQAIETDYLPSHPEVYWGLPLKDPPSEGIIASLYAGRAIHYTDIRSFADFIFIQLGWFNGGLHFIESHRIALERNEVSIRRQYLCELLPNHREVVNRCCDFAQSALERRARGEQ